MTARTASPRGGGGVAAPSMQGWAASMTNTGFVALPILQATYGPRAVLPAAIATVFVAVVMFPCAVVLQELDPDEHIVVVCHHGVRSLSVTNWLRQQGFENVQSMRGGIDGWARTVDPKVPLY